MRLVRAVLASTGWYATVPVLGLALVLTVAFPDGRISQFGPLVLNPQLRVLVVVPMLMAVGISPELTQAAYRVGDSCINPIAPMNPYVVVMLVFMQRFMPKAGLGSLIALMLPYAVILLAVWTGMLLVWVGLDLPLGPGREPLFIAPMAR